MVLKVSPHVMDIGVFCCLIVVHIYRLCSAGYPELPIVNNKLLELRVTLEKTRRALVG